MLQQPTMEKLETMRLHGMAQALRELAANEQSRELSFEDRLALLVDRQFTWRQNEAMQARLRRAKLRNNACIEDIDYRAARGLDKTLLRSLAADSSWVTRHENIFVCGPTGVGKATWHARWRRRRAATAIRRGTRGPWRCSATWRWHAPTAACVICCCG